MKSKLIAWVHVSLIHSTGVSTKRVRKSKDTTHRREKWKVLWAQKK